MVNQGLTVDQGLAALQQYLGQQQGNNLNVATGSAFTDAIMQMLLGILSGKLSASEMAGYLPGDLLGMEGVLPTLARQQYQSGTMFDLASLLANPRDAAQLQYLSTLAGGGDPFGTAQATNTPLTGEGWQTLIDNLTQRNQAPTPSAATNPTGTSPTTPNATAQRALDTYARATQAERDALARATPEELAALWQGGQAPGMAKGGQMVINEPSVIMGLLSRKPYATLAEGGKPENVDIQPVRQFAKGGKVSVTNSRYSGPNAFTTKSRAKLGGYKGRMQDLTPAQRTKAGVGQAGEGSTAWQKLQPGYTPAGSSGGTSGGTGSTPTAYTMTQQAPANAGELAALLQKMLVPTPSSISQLLYSQLLPYQLEGLLGGASGAGMPTDSYLAQMKRYWQAAPSYPTTQWGF